MKKLTQKEEEIMKVIWELEKAFVKDVQEKLESPKPHVNTVSTVMRKLVKKGFLAFEDFGTTYRYYPKISRDVYSKQYLSPHLADFFGDSYKDIVAFFVKDEKLSADDLKEILEMIEQKKSKND